MTEAKKKTPCNIALLAHVDAGKTTLSEALLYTSGARRSLGRVDHRDAFLDTHNLERARGITIFSKQARMETANRMVTLVDTPGHVDFSAETERTLPVVDCAVLEEDGITILDFKTDRVTKETLPAVAERYQTQVRTYAEAMERIYGKPVKGAFLYFFHMDTFAQIPLG